MNFVVYQRVLSLYLCFTFYYKPRSKANERTNRLKLMKNLIPIESRDAARNYHDSSGAMREPNRDGVLEAALRRAWNLSRGHT